MRIKININIGGVFVLIDYYVMRINYLVFSLKNKIYIFNVWNVLIYIFVLSI